MNDVIVYSVFDVGCAILPSKQLPGVRFILGEESFQGLLTARSQRFAMEPCARASMTPDPGIPYSLGNTELLDRA